MKKNDYKLPELEEIKRITDEFLKKADEFIKRQKEYNKQRASKEC